MKPMRRKRQALSIEESIAILKRGNHGTLALCYQDEPYAVPLSYAYEQDTLYFHCAKEGLKLDIIQKQNNVSFCVVEQDEILPEKFTTLYQSVIVSGKAELVQNEEEIKHALLLLCDKYSKGFNAEEEIKKCLQKVCIIRLNIKEISGKQGIELVGKKSAVA